MKKFKLLSLALALVMIFTLAACGSGDTTPADTSKPADTSAPADTSIFESADAPTYTLKAGHVQATAHPYHTGLVYFGELLAERSNGKITVEVYPSSQLGSERELTEGVQMGTVDCAVVGSAVLANFDPNFGILSLPFIFDNREHAYALFESEYCDNLYKSCEAYGITGLAWYENGFFDVLSKVPVDLPEDIVGLNIRTMENSVYMDTYTAAGANPVPMAFGEVYTSLQNGTIDGVSTSVTAAVPNNFQEVAPYFCVVNMSFTPTPMIFSSEILAEMPEEYQALIKECAVESAHYEWDQIVEQEQSGADAFAAAGGAVTTTSDRQAWIDLIADYVWSNTSFTTEQIDEIRNWEY